MLGPAPKIWPPLPDEFSDCGVSRGDVGVPLFNVLERKKKDRKYDPPLVEELLFGFNIN